MFHKRTKIACIAAFIGFFMPLSLFASTDSLPPPVQDICTATANKLSNLVRPAFSSMSVVAGESVSIPLNLKNETGTPLDDIHLLMRVTKIGGHDQVVLLRYEPKIYELLPGATASTSLRWDTAKNTENGVYRVDVFVMPSASYMNGGLVVDVPAPANVLIQVENKTDVGPARATFDSDHIVVNGRDMRMRNAVLFDEHERGDYKLHIRNTDTVDTKVTVWWRVYSDQRIDQKDLLFATSTVKTVPAKGIVIADFSVPVEKGFQYTIVAELKEGDQSTLAPIIFYRASREPLPISIFGIMSDGGSGGPFDVQKGKKYTLFACPLGMPTLLPSTLTLKLAGGMWKTFTERSVTNTVNVAPSSLIFDFIAPADVSNATLTLSSSMGGKNIRHITRVSCMGSTGNECIAPSAQPVATDLLYTFIAISIFLIILIGIILVRHKHAHK